MAAKTKPKLVKDDPWLEPFTSDIRERLDRFRSRKAEINRLHKSVKRFASAHQHLGINYDRKKKGWWYREWAPKAKSLSLVGDFNHWDPNKHKLSKKDQGVWEVFVPNEDGLEHLGKVKVRVNSALGELDRIPAYIRYVTQDPETHDFAGRIWFPNRAFDWTDGGFTPKPAHQEPYIYECHVGMAQQAESVGSYVDFADKVLPRIRDQGYNAIQVMAIQEHPYYGSFGYHVSNFFAPSSRFGTPDDLKYMVNRAHEIGIAVIMDIVHSHAVKNVAEGLSQFDGSEDQYFHEGGRGYHTGWDSMLFNYGKEEVLQFLLSNVRYWIEEFHIDGFRYDGVTSMLYFHHGDHVSFDGYDKYFSDVDWDVLIYLQLANELAHQLRPNAITIAEDMSGMPGLCRPVREGGIGFDFRLGMGIPDFWIKTLKHKRDEDWDVHELWGTLSNRRRGERTIAYAESHDQALVGDKSIAFWLMDKEMYTHMHVDFPSAVIDRGIALHKMIRLLTISLGGEGWLNFIGNEFGHPEWVDFPREGNDWSYKYARRQWSLSDNQELKYRYMNDFGRDVVRLMKEHEVLSSSKAIQLNLDQENHTLIYERRDLIFALNFSPTNSVPDYRFSVPVPGSYEIILNSDQRVYGGFERVDNSMTYPTVTLIGEHFLSVYLPSRAGLVLKKVDSSDKS